MLEGLILGIAQGIAEWIPISSEGILVLVGMKFFGSNLAESVSVAVFLHLGTFAAALLYFWKDVISVFKKENRNVLSFLFFSTLVTGVVGLPLFYFGIKYLNGAAGAASAFIGVFLIITGVAQFKKPESVFRLFGSSNSRDAFFVGMLQGFSSLPGFSRSGLTVAGLLFRKFKDTDALKLSFLMSLPAVLGGNIILNLSGISVADINFTLITALVVSFVVGLLMIRILLRISQKINFGWFAIFFGVLTLVSLFFV